MTATDVTARIPVVVSWPVLRDRLLVGLDPLMVEAYSRCLDRVPGAHRLEARRGRRTVIHDMAATA